MKSYTEKDSFYMKLMKFVEERRFTNELFIIII